VHSAEEIKLHIICAPVLIATRSQVFIQI